MRPRIAQTVRFFSHPHIAQTFDSNNLVLWFLVFICVHREGRLRTISGLSLASLTSRAMRNRATANARCVMSLWLQQRAACMIIGQSARSVPAPLANLMRAFNHHESRQRRGLCSHLRRIPRRVMVVIWLGSWLNHSIPCPFSLVIANILIRWRKTNWRSYTNYSPTVFIIRPCLTLLLNTQHGKISFKCYTATFNFHLQPRLVVSPMQSTIFAWIWLRISLEWSTSWSK